MPQSSEIRGARRGRVAAILLACLALTACRTPKPPTAEKWPERQREFLPLVSVSTIHSQEARYPDLFAPETFAVWVDPEVAALKRAEAVGDNKAIDPRLDQEAAAITRQYLVIECHLSSVFGDMSVAYDAVGLRGMQVYLEMPDGRTVPPIQTVIDVNMAEAQAGALKRFGRTNLIIFPRRDLWMGKPTVDPASPKVRLVLEGIASKFFFEWPQAPADAQGLQPPTKEQMIYAVQLGYCELFERIRLMGQTFQ